MKADLNAGHSLDFNILSATQKQVALALQDNDEARFCIKDGRRMVVNKTPNPLIQLLTLGSRG